MKTSELISSLTSLMDAHGDLPVFLDTNPIQLVGIDDVGIDCEADVLVIWAKEPGE